MKHQTPLMLLGAGGSIDAEQAIDLIAAIVRMVRPVDGLSPHQGILAPTSDRSADHDGQVTADQTINVSRHLTTSPTSRVRYSLKGVRDGHTLHLETPTPGMVKVVNYLKTHPKSTLRDVMEGTSLSRNTVANLFTHLRKQKILLTEHA